MDAFLYETSEEYKKGYLEGRFTTNFPEDLKSLPIHYCIGMSDGRHELNAILFEQKNNKTFYEQLMDNLYKNVYLVVPYVNGQSLVIKGQLGLGMSAVDYLFTVQLEQEFAFGISRVESIEVDNGSLTIFLKDK